MNIKKLETYIYNLGIYHKNKKSTLKVCNVIRKYALFSFLNEKHF